MRRAAKRDANEGAIVAALEAAGCVVEHLSARDVPDLLVWSPFTWSIYLLEVKRPKKKLRPGQAAFFARWASTGAPVHLVDGINAALLCVGIGPPRPSHTGCRCCDGDGWVTEKHSGATFKSVCPLVTLPPS